MGAAGRNACVEKYNWDRVGGDIASVIASLAKR